MKNLFLAAAFLFFLGFNNSVAFAQTAKGQTVLANYSATGLCAQTDPNVREIRLRACTRDRSQEFFVEYFNDIARHDSKPKIMNGKDCLRGGWIDRDYRFFTERCYITTWSKDAFWRHSPSGFFYTEDNYCLHRKDNGTAIGTLLLARECDKIGWGIEELYPAILTRSAQIGPLTIANLTPGQNYKAIITENGYSAGNLVASEGSQLIVDRNGRVSATNGGYIIAGGSGHKINTLVSKIAGANILKSSDFVLREPSSHIPSNLDFFTGKKRGESDYRIH